MKSLSIFNCFRLNKAALFSCVFVLTAVLPAHLMAVTIDGNVQGRAEGYTSGFSVNFDIENGPADVPGGSLFTYEDDSYLYFGLVLPLNIVDNTYGDNKASDWGSVEHYLIGGGGGKSLEGSDKWEFKYTTSAGEAIELKLDYIDYDDGTGDFSSRIEKFKKDGVDLDKDMIQFASSLEYNYYSGLYDSSFGTKEEDEDGDPIDSPADFAGGWIPEIMYEFGIDKEAFSGDWFEFEKSVIHASPNKGMTENVDAKNKVFPKLGEPVNPVPEPATLFLLGTGLIGFAGFRKKLKR